MGNSTITVLPSSMGLSCNPDLPPKLNIFFRANTLIPPRTTNKNFKVKENNNHNAPKNEAVNISNNFTGIFSDQNQEEIKNVIAKIKHSEHSNKENNSSNNVSTNKYYKIALKNKEHEHVLKKKIEDWVEKNHQFGDSAKTIFISNIDYEVDEKLLEKNFKYYGKIKKVTIIRDTNGKSRGYGFIEFFNTSDCKEAYNKMHNVRILKNNIYIDYQKSCELNFLPMKLGGYCGRNRKYKKDMEIKLNEIYHEYPNLKPDNLVEYKRLVIKRIEKREKDKINIDESKKDNNHSNNNNELNLKEVDFNMNKSKLDYSLKFESKKELDNLNINIGHEHENINDNEDYLNKKRNSKHFKENDCENENINEKEKNQHFLIEHNNKPKQNHVIIKDEVLKNKFECDKRSDNSSN